MIEIIITDNTNMDKLKEDLSKVDFSKMDLTKDVKELLNILGIKYA